MCLDVNAAYSSGIYVQLPSFSRAGGWISGAFMYTCPPFRRRVLRLNHQRTRG
jgi:hypothetical protein